MTAPKIPSSETKSTSVGGIEPPGRIKYPTEKEWQTLIHDFILNLFNSFHKPFDFGGKMRSIRIHAERSTSDIFYI